ncbi:AraC family transcriptional regulator [Polaromonas naphthalenivorans]|uniref:Transcriptional regulator, AraC family n=1 Tax=Polaromonas naphthalenivorans (strain CJ2) TaxID=365044 RepID=A1VJG3_POLNA|nr:AraC family transcriptional regulator [Polaromonas naphthalenivorans]ABM35791.1 transcriptional regulator, AraC family [Polaromonas naphthalenivorans CJ2]
MPELCATPASPRPALEPAITPMAFVQAIALAYERRGLSPAAALAQAQIAPSSLHDASTCITAWQMERLCGTAMQELDDEALGWFSRRLPWGSYGMLARASLSAPSLGVALKRWCRHHGLIADDIALTLSVSGDTALLAITEQRDLGALREFCLVSVLRNILGVACWLIDSRIPLLGAQFPFAAPPHRDVYAVLFSGPTAFDTAPAGLRFDARYLALPLRRDERALQQMLERALPLTVLPYRRDRLLVQRVRQALAANPAQTHSAQALAALVHVSPRTLHRQLKEEGASLQALKDEVRRARALELLLRTRRPIKQVAEAAGFQNEKSFMRAFKTWTGQSPAEFRRGGQGLDSSA